MTKQVALADRTYERLRRNRMPGESFSQAIERLLDERKKEPRRFLQLPRGKLDPEEWLARIEADRDGATVRA